MTPLEGATPTDGVTTPSQTSAACKKINLANPAAVYCVLMGFSSKIVETDQGQAGACVFPDGATCDEWAFLAGKCGTEHSYCAQNGYGIKTVTDGQDPFSQEYAVCTDSAGKVVGMVTDLSGLQQQLQCGSQLSP
jgi:putative hemolysin